MTGMNPKVDGYLRKSKQWQEELQKSVLIIRFTNVQQIVKLEPVLKVYINEAIDVEKAGLKVKLKKNSQFKIREEFHAKLDEIPALKKAFPP